MTCGHWRRSRKSSRGGSGRHGCLSRARSLVPPPAVASRARACGHVTRSRFSASGRRNATTAPRVGRFTVARHGFFSVINSSRPLLPSALRKLEEGQRRRPCARKARFRLGSSRRVWRGNVGDLMLACKAQRPASEALPPNDPTLLTPEDKGRPQMNVRPVSAMLLVADDALPYGGGARSDEHATFRRQEVSSACSHMPHDTRLTYQRGSSTSAASAARSRSGSRPGSSMVRETIFMCACKRGSSRSVCADPWAPLHTCLPFVFQSVLRAKLRNPTHTAVDCLRECRSLSASECSIASTRPRSRDGLPSSPTSTRPSTSHSLYSRDVMDLRPWSSGSVVSTRARPYSGSGSVIESDRVEWSGLVAVRSNRRPLTSVGRSMQVEGGMRVKRERPSTALGMKSTAKFSGAMSRDARQRAEHDGFETFELHDTYEDALGYTPLSGIDPYANLSAERHPHDRFVCVTVYDAMRLRLSYKLPACAPSDIMGRREVNAHAAKVLCRPPANALLVTSPTSLLSLPSSKMCRNVAISPLELFLSRSASPLKKASPARPRSSYAYLPAPTGLQADQAAGPDVWNRGAVRARPATSRRVRPATSLGRVKE